ncbi:hypothetical protein AUD35_23425, partial [Salmonella enterica subsp. enterica serovar Newport]|nr:hypothetical protein [Salmonella enterica subsp. enterica serovar Newport]
MQKPVLSYELFLEYGGEGGIDSLCSPLRGSPFAVRPVCPTGCAATQPIPGPRPFGAARSLCARSVQLAAPLLSPSLGLAPSGPEQALFKNAPGVFVSNPGRVFSSPLSLGDIYKQKARTS